MPSLLILSMLLAQWSFVVFVGGDWMPNSRFISHVIPLVLALLVLCLVQSLQFIGSQEKSSTLIIAAYVLGSISSRFTVA
jgi:hypothetical protein